MKHKVPLFLLPLIAAAWSTLPSCSLTSKEPQDKPAAGRVLEYGTLAPIADATVTLYECEGEVLGSFSCKGISSTLSDKDGRYSFSETGFLTNAHKDGYFTDQTTEAQVLFGSEDKADIILPPYAWLKVLLDNQSGAYQFSGLTGSYPDLPEINFFLAQGTDTTFVCLAQGNRDFKYLFTVFTEPNQPSLQDFSNIKIKKSDDTVIEIEKILTGGKFYIYLSGHDTTAITITY